MEPTTLRPASVTDLGLLSKWLLNIEFVPASIRFGVNFRPQERVL